MPSPTLIIAALLTGCFTLGTYFERRQAERSNRREGASLLTVLMGDSRRMFADHFFERADVYYHSGYYPTIFDQQRLHDKPAMAVQAGAVSGGDHSGHAHDEQGRCLGESPNESSFLGEPRDWLDRFSRHFYVSRHTHLEGDGVEREILPWLRMAAELDPHRTEVYTVTAFWLRSRLGKVREAELFLREGWRANPDNPEILFALGQLYFENRQDAERARNLWEAALRYWQKQEAGKAEPNIFLFAQIVGNLVRLEEQAGRIPDAIHYLEVLKQVSVQPSVIEQQIAELKEKLP